MKNKHIYLIIALIIVGFTLRLLPHPANFAPIMALALFSGLYLPKRLNVIIPVVAMLISDIFLGFYSLPIMFSVYASFILATILGTWLKKHKNLGNVILTTFAGSALFFLATNFSVWTFGTMYTHNLPGLMQSYYMALPFFRNSLLGDLFYVGIFVGVAEMSIRYLQSENTVTNKI
ncbi:MAG: hypothetical protein COY69_02445 [Candidatus Magasanikbacteria bacterium CG_4_10_14_0_8_um_filter_32_14]|uniref:ECF transporter S component n=2 Tax=Candidatus Magasanikiibacteriota TaxID=1752731 RepID=A0A2M7R9V9_9BACT|nr:MAG: hypothetical protein AUJ23_01000 [Candidatus Magasanikbacteria bacterium CG1_02_32_51]PIY93282.1 MAG: hypothetical protein COY69_02445 [Candidatus Magasanikbacteria bacterium CG_4_10_14_0_8_um_filter_32_14]